MVRGGAASVVTGQRERRKSAIVSAQILRQEGRTVTSGFFSVTRLNHLIVHVLYFLSDVYVDIF